MRAIMLMFDSLKKNWLPPYGGDIIAPNFRRLGERTAVFDNFYVGSLPCMPARRELHTGRYSFFHEGWSPLEPYDDSVPQILKENGIHTHLVSDHHHYWREGGGNYHGRYTTYEHVRGQEGDAWKAVVGAGFDNTTMSDQIPPMFSHLFAQDSINRRYMEKEEDHCQTVTFDLGLEFIETNKDADKWFLQMECFDPHEPFFTYDEYRKLYPGAYKGRHIDWPQPGSTGQPAETMEYVKNQYKALVSMIDRNLGRLLDTMDQNDMWEDTMLIVNTDHGLLLGEHDWWSKGCMPVYNEIANIPFFIWDPRSKVKGERRKSLAQNIDVAATLLAFFGLELPQDMEGKPLTETVRNDTPVHDCILFGYYGGTANITDGRYVYMRGPASEANEPLYEYTLIPAKMSARADIKELQNLDLAEPFAFTKGCKTLKIDMSGHNSPFSNVYRYGSRLYDLQMDPGQKQSINASDIEFRLVTKLIEKMEINDAPAEQYARLGLIKGMTESALIKQKEEFAQAWKADVLPGLDWTPSAISQYKTLAAMLHDPTLPSRFEEYVKDEGVIKIEPFVIYGFAGKIVPKDKEGMIIMMLKLSERMD